MLTNVKRTMISTAAAISLLIGAGCELDLENPNAPTEEEVVTSIDGAVALAVGMQDQFASSIDDFLVTSSLITDEWGTQTLALVSYRSLVDGESFDPSFLVVEAPWAASYETIKSANTLMSAVPNLGLGVGLETGIIAIAKVFKAMSFGVLIQNYEQVPIDVSIEGPVPEERAVVLDTILGLLESARSDLETVTDDDLAVFSQRILGAGFDFRNTVDAMLARYYLIAGQHAEALAAAERVALDVVSVFTYAAPDRNPVENLAFQLRYVAALQSFTTDAETGDGRVAYWVDVEAAPLTGNPDSLLLPIAKFSGPTEAYPVYLPDEMRLIMAEAYTQMAMFTEARDAINAVRTQSSSSLDEPVANLGALDATDLPDGDTDAFLAQIAYERRYELYMQGLRWEDVRRLGEAFTTTPVMDFLPIPQQECDTNPSNPCGSGG